MALERDQFEEAALAHFVAQRAAGVQISGDNGCEPTRESLFWRDDKGDYGVRMFNAAWWGWKEAAVATRKTCEVPPLDDAKLARLAEIERQEPVAEMTLVDMGIGDARQLRVNWLMDGYLDVGAKLYASAGASPVEPSQAVVVEPVYQYQLANGNWIDQTKESYDYNVKRGQATVRMLYATPQAAPQPKETK